MTNRVISGYATRVNADWVIAGFGELRFLLEVAHCDSGMAVPAGLRLTS
jgi:hypothetical protein